MGLAAPVYGPGKAPAPAPKPVAGAPAPAPVPQSIVQMGNDSLAAKVAADKAARDAADAAAGAKVMEQLMGGRTPEQVAQQRGLPLDQSNALTARFVAATVQQQNVMAGAPPGTSGQVGFDAAMRAFGPIEPWIGQAMAAERNAAGGAPVLAVDPTTGKYVGGVGVTYDLNGQTYVAQMPPTWNDVTKNIFTEATQDPKHKGRGQYIPDPNLLPAGATQHSDGLEDIGGMLAGNSFNREIAPYAGAAIGTMIAPGIGTALGATLGGLAQKGYDKNSEGKTVAGAGTGAGTDGNGAGVVTTGPGGAGPGAPGAGTGSAGTPAAPTVSLAAAAADVYAKSVDAQQATQAADVAAGKVSAAQAALADAVTPQQIQAARAELAAAVSAQQTTAAQIDLSKQAFFRDYQTKNVSALSDQAEGKGPSLAYAMFQRATDENLANIKSQAATARGGNVASAGSAAIYATGNLQAKAAQDAGILRLKEQMDARAQLGAALESGRSGDIGLATSQANLTQANDLANADRTLRADTTNQGNVRDTNLANAGFQQQANVQNAANALQAALAAQKEANDNYKFNASEANRVALDNANRQLQAAIANQGNARDTSQFNTEQGNKVAIGNADRDLSAAVANQGNAARNTEFNAGQTNNVNVAGYQGGVTMRGQDVAAATTARGQDLNYAVSRRTGDLSEKEYDDKKDASVIKGLSDLGAIYASQNKTTTTGAK